MDGLTLVGTMGLVLPVLGFHLVSVTLTKALRTYSRSRLEDVCEARGHAARADDVAHHDERTEHASETLAVVTGLMLAALLGVAVDREAPSLAVKSVIAIALSVAGIGYVLAGVTGRVFAEPVIVLLWPAALWLRLVTGPMTFGIRKIESLVERLARKPDTTPRPSSVEVEIPADADHPEDHEADLPESTRELLQHAVALTRRDVNELMTPRSSIVICPRT